MKTFELVKSTLGKPYEDLEYLLLCLKEVLAESGESALSDDIPWISGIREDILQSFSGKAFAALVGMFSVAEHRRSKRSHAKQAQKEDNLSLREINGLWSYNLHQLKSAGYTAEEIALRLSGDSRRARSDGTSDRSQKNDHAGAPPKPLPAHCKTGEHHVYPGRAGGTPERD
jgi:hypothetical protein